MEGVTEKRATLEVPPVAVGLTTVTVAVPLFAISVEGITAINCEVLIKVVGRGLPFQFTKERETNPVPFTVRVKSPPPGALASGIRGRLTTGTCAKATADQKRDS